MAKAPNFAGCGKGWDKKIVRASAPAQDAYAATLFAEQS